MCLNVMSLGTKVQILEQSDEMVNDWNIFVELETVLPGTTSPILTNLTIATYQSLGLLSDVNELMSSEPVKSLSHRYGSGRAYLLCERAGVFLDFLQVRNFSHTDCRDGAYLLYECAGVFGGREDLFSNVWQW